MPAGRAEKSSLGNPASIAFINRRSQRGKLGFVMLFLALQCSQRRADKLAGAFVTAAIDLCRYEAVKLIG